MIVGVEVKASFENCSSSGRLSTSFRLAKLGNFGCFYPLFPLNSPFEASFLPSPVCVNLDEVVLAAKTTNHLSEQG